MGKIKDMKGKQFERLTVIDYAGSCKGYAMWRCKCECGNEIIVRGSDLRSGNTQSCGCLQRDNTAKRHTTHGLEGSRLYLIWENMKTRCYNKSNERYKDYGGRGIKVYEEWKNDFQSFYNWAVNNGYSDNLTIDRIDNDKGYCPENCRWTSRKEQANNRRSNHLIAFNGERHNITQWAEITGINENTLRTRIRRGWPIEKALRKAE